MARAASGAPTAIVVGDEPRRFIAIARSLCRHGVRVIVASQREEASWVSSRSIASIVQLNDSIEEAAELLLMLAESTRAAWVIPTSDSSLRVASAAYGKLAKLCAIACPRPDVVRRVLDKSLTVETAIDCGVPVPFTLTIRDADDLGAAATQTHFPIVALPSGETRATSHNVRPRIFTSASQLRDAFAASPHFGDGLLFQHYHGGPTVGLDLLVVDGQIIASFQHRRLSENPPSGGTAAVAESEPVHPTLLNYTDRLLRALHWDGIAAVEFRRDRDTGDPILTKVSGHFSGALALAVTAGLDLPYYAWRSSQRFATVIPARYRHGLRMRWTAASLERFAHIFAQGEEKISMWSGTRQLFADFGPGTQSAMWSWRDPFLAAQDVLRLARTRWNDTATRLVRRIVSTRAVVNIRSVGQLSRPARNVFLRRKIAHFFGRPHRVTLPPHITSVLFVCHANRIRSAAAAQFLREALKTVGVVDVRVCSAGTHARDGSPADPRAAHATRQLGIALDEHRATRITAELVESSDLILAMDEFNFANIFATFTGARTKVLLFGGITPSGIYRSHEIDDPNLAGRGEFVSTIALIRGYASSLALALAQRRSDAL